jgi:hypothetical protein
MWLFTRYGFFSVCRAHKLPARKYPVPDPKGYFMVRARCYEHLESLCSAFTVLHHVPILTSTKTDYPYRIVVHRDAWMDVAGKLALEVDYVNFKEECHKARPKDVAYHEALMRVWALLRWIDPSFKEQERGNF